ncbi:ABC transporter permease [candidate division KSB1 bacterium]
MNVQESFNIGIEALKSHKLRSFLTMLGIIFGVGAVISMLSIGEGAKQEALDQIKLLGMNNIIIQDFPARDTEQGTDRTNFSMGLNLADGEAIKAICPLVLNVVPHKELDVEIRYEAEIVQGMVIGTFPEYDEVMNFKVREGMFFDYRHMEEMARVCVVGNGVKRELFYFSNPIGKKIKLGQLWFTVIGVMEDKGIGGGKGGTLRTRNLNLDIYIPITTALKRFQHNWFDSEIDQLVLKVKETGKIRETANIAKNIIDLRHNGIEDYQIVIPEELLKQSQRTQKIFNIVMGAIAGISLLVGGIGIMNIMLASVMERTREIGVRRAVGATRKDILGQFIIEAIVLSFTGGIVGVVLGFGMTKAITVYAGWKTIVTISSIFLAFGVSVAVGMIFGIFPAKKASELDVIDSLRYE